MQDYLALVGLVVLVISVTILLRRRLYAYDIDEKVLKLRWLGFFPIFPILFTIRLEDIDDVQVVPWLQFWRNPINYTALSFGPMVQRSIVLLHRRRGIFRRLVIAPENPQGFAENLQEAITRAGGCILT